MLFECLILVAFFLAGVIYLARSQVRTSLDVLTDLGMDREEQEFQPKQGKNYNNNTIRQSSDRLLLREARLFSFISALIGVIYGSIFLYAAPSRVLLLGTVGACIGYLIAKKRSRARADKLKKQLEFYLPIVMERVVMAVQAGLDVLPALSTIIDLNNSRSLSGDNDEKKDPVTNLLANVYNLTVSGVPFEDALRHIASTVQCPGVRHAFIHLAVAHREGGELILPLRELSDSTQSYYQESVEEEIAKIPAKATLPLVCTFAGLIVCFITVPIIQIIELTKTAMPTG